MNITITPRLSRNRSKLFYTLEWGKKAGQRMATGLYTYVHPENSLQRKHNKEVLELLEIKKSQFILDAASIGTNFIPAHRYQGNFMTFYENYVKENKRIGNRHLEGSFNQFKKFLKSGFISPKDITEEFCSRFQYYLLTHLNGETPSNYFARFKKVLKSATSQGYFHVNPSQDISTKANTNKRRKGNLEAEEYIRLLHVPSLNEEIKDAFVFCCYTGLRWCDVKSLTWNNTREDAIAISIIQKKTDVETYITLHPIAKKILNKRKTRLKNFDIHKPVFTLPSADGANKILSRWCNAASIQKRITWGSARLSFSILLQDANVDTATVALLLGHTTTKYVEQIYKRYRPKDMSRVISLLPS